PLLRMTLIRVGEDRHDLVVTNHHIVMDGWSLPIVVEELLRIYADGGSASGLGRVTPYRDYLGWLGRQDGAAALAAWREALCGVEEGTLVAPRAAVRASCVPSRLDVEVSAELTLALSLEARRHGVTVNSYIQGVWGLLLGRLLGR